MEDLGEAHHTAWAALLKSHARLLERINRQVTAEGELPLEWYDVLLTLENAPDRRMRMSELAEAVLFSRSGLTRLVDRLEKAGLLRREAVPTDRRGAYAVLTPQGEETRRKAWPVYRNAIAQNFARRLSEEEAGTLADLLRRALPSEDER